MQKNKPKVAIYCRLSEEDRNKQSDTDDSRSIRNQKSMLSRYAFEHGWEIYQIYSDDDYTGSDRCRPQFNRLLADAESGKFDIILCKTQSRFTRELELVEKYIHCLFPLWNIRFVSVVDNADTADRSNKKSRQINGLINEWYLEDMSENIKSVLTDMRKSGRHIGSFAPYGYQKDPLQKGHLIIDETAASIVREIFTLFAQGYGKTAIARILNDRQIPNPSEYKRLCKMRYRQPQSHTGTLWKYYTVASILTNEMYIGNMVQGKYESISYKTKKCRPRRKEEWYIVPGTHEPIIDKKLWEQVQTLISQKTKPFSTGKTGLFAGKVRCMNCGCTMRSCKSRGRHYLQCPTRHISRESCPGAFLSVESLENAVCARLNQFASTFLDKTFLEQNFSDCSISLPEYDLLEKQLSACRKKLSVHTESLRLLYSDRAEGRILESDCQDLYTFFSDKKNRLQNQIRKLEGELENARLKALPHTEAEFSPSAIFCPQNLNRTVIDLFIRSISAGRRIPGTSEVPVEIYWDF